MVWMDIHKVCSYSSILKDNENCQLSGKEFKNVSFFFSLSFSFSFSQCFNDAVVLNGTLPYAEVHFKPGGTV